LQEILIVLSLNALQWVGTPELILKLEQRSTIIKLAYGCLPSGIWEVTMLPDASVCFDMYISG